jgi:GntR family transcriptional regulator/MocR family aminotransferase
MVKRSKNRENDWSMIHPTPNLEDLLKLDRADATPLHRQIYARVRHGIEHGLLRPGDRLASARSLAAELGVARGTVELAYQQLAGEGYVMARGQGGTVVSPQLAVHLKPLAAPRVGAHPASQPTASRLPASKARSTTTERVHAPVHGPAALPIGARMLLPLQPGVPALDAFPRKLWSRLVARRARSTGLADLAYGDPCGYRPLREAIASYLLVSRGVACTPEQVFITAGHRASLALLTRTLLRPDDRIWIEDPGFAPVADLLRAAGYRPVPVPVDAQGMVVEQGESRAPRARMAVVTPSHQAPLGVALSMPRRLALLQWATRAKAWIVEDDYDGEYRYAGSPLPALKSLDRADRVAYAGSFSKVLYPGLGLAYLVVPATLVQRCAETAGTWSNGCSQLTQAVVADFMAQGHFARHVKKMRLLYARRRSLLADALRKAFGDRIEIALSHGGMHLLMRLHEATDDVAMAQRAQQAGMSCQALSERSVSRAGPQGLMLGFTNITSAAHAHQISKRLRQVVG